MHPKALLNYRTILVSAACLLLANLIYSAQAGTNQYESLDYLKTITQDWLQSELGQHYDIKVKFGYVDPRHRLAKCPQKPTSYFADPQTRIGATSIGIRCDTDTSWSIVIPVQIRAFTHVVVAQQSLAKDAHLTKNDVVIERRELTSIHADAFTKIDQVEDMILKRPVSKGTILTATLLKPKRLVSRGETVTILAQSTSLSIRVQGTALMDGHRGQTIRVQNSSSKHELFAEVIAPAVVKVKM